MLNVGTVLFGCLTEAIDSLFKMTFQPLLLVGWFYRGRQSTGEGEKPWQTFCLRDYTTTFAEREDIISNTLL